MSRKNPYSILARIVPDFGNVKFVLLNTPSMMYLQSVIEYSEYDAATECY